jgi:uncharacterized iron-regulated membrane protein
MKEVRSIAWPTAGDGPAWTVAAAERALSIDDRSGAIQPARVRPHGGPGIAGVMRRVHDGEGMGAVWQTIVFVGGILPALLAITGVIMWWRARGWRKALDERTRQARGRRYPA